MKTILAVVLLIAYTFAQDSNLIGEWYEGSVASTQYYSPSTGAWAPTSGSGWGMSIGNERFTETGLLQSTMYGCTLAVFYYQRGRLDTLGDNRIRLSPIHGGTRRVTNNCPTKDDSVEFAQHRIYTWNITTDSSGNRYVNLFSEASQNTITLRYRGEVQNADDTNFDVSEAMPNVNFNPDPGTLENSDPGPADAPAPDAPAPSPNTDSPSSDTPAPTEETSSPDPTAPTAAPGNPTTTRKPSTTIKAGSTTRAPSRSSNSSSTVIASLAVILLAFVAPL